MVGGSTEIRLLRPSPDAARSVDGAAADAHVRDDPLRPGRSCADLARGNGAPVAGRATAGPTWSRQAPLAAVRRLHRPRGPRRLRDLVDDRRADYRDHPNTTSDHAA